MMYWNDYLLFRYMPILDPPPNDEVITEKTIIGLSNSSVESIKTFLNIKPWTCSCALKNFGRNMFCANFRCNLPRPANFKEEQRG